MSAARLSVFIAFRNAAAYLPQCLAALAAQRYRNWEAYLVDDASEDSSAEIAAHLIQPLGRRITFVRNAVRRGKVQNFLDAVPLLRGDVFVEYDGDDWFATPCAFSVIASAYEAGADATTGRAACASTGEEPRILDYPACHRYALTTITPVNPRTVKLDLVRRIVTDHCDLFTDPQTGQAWSAWGDVVLSAPAMLLAKRIVPLRDRILYIINDTSPYRDCRMFAEAEWSRLARDTFAACMALEERLQGPVDWENHAA